MKAYLLVMWILCGASSILCAINRDDLEQAVYTVAAGIHACAYVIVEKLDELKRK